MKKLQNFVLTVNFVFLSVIAVSKPVVSFIASESEACAPANIMFTNTSAGCSGYEIFDWTSGAGDISHIENPVFYYATGGVYIVSLTVHCDGFDVTETMQITIFDPPVADFSIPSITGCVPYQVSFTDLSTPGDGTIDAWFWDFGDGNTSSDQSPQHTYSLGSLYNVSLIVTDDNECYSMGTHNGLVSVANNPYVSFYADNTNSCYAPLDVNFTSNVITSFGLNSYYNWDFGDGHTSSAANPSNTYTASGLYYVSLAVTDEYGCSTVLAKPDYVQIDQGIPEYSVNEGDTV